MPEIHSEPVLTVCACLLQWHVRTRMHALYIGNMMVQTWCAIDSTAYCCALRTLSCLD